MAEKNSAISTLLTRIRLEPNNPEAHFNLAVAYEEAGSYDNAMSEYEETLDLNPAYARATMHIGFIQIKRQKPAEALALWETAFEKDKNLSNLFKTSPTAAYYKGKIDEVAAFFHKKVQEAPKNATAHYELGLIYKYFNKLELALQCFRTATEINGVMWEAYLKCGETFALLGQTKMAIEQLKYGTLANPGNKNPVIHLALAEVYMTENMMGYAQQQLDKALSLDPKSVKAYIMYGKLFFRLSNFKRAMQQYQKALEIDQFSSEAHYQLAKTCEAMYRPDFALIELEKAVANNPDFAEAYYDWGNLLMQMGDAEKAIPKLEYVLKINQNDAYAHYTLGTAYLKIEDYHAAMHHFKASTQLNQSDAYTYYNLGICCVKTRDVNGALSAFLKAMELSPNDASYCYQRYLVNMSQMNFEEAANDIKRAIKANPAEVDYRLKLVALYKKQKDYKAIIEELNEFININPKIASVYSEMGIAYSAMGETSIAKVSFERALGIDPDDVRAIYGKASLLKESGIKLREAKEMFSKALEIDPYFLPALEDLGLMYFEEGDAEKGSKYYKTAIDHASPEELNGVKINYAQVLMRTGHADEGISVFSSLIQDHPDDARLRLSLAKAYETIEKYDDAINELQVAQELEPENPDYPMALGGVYTELGLIDEARDTYYTIINMYPTHREAQDALGRLLSQNSAPTARPAAPELSHKRQTSSIPTMDIPSLDFGDSKNTGMAGSMLPDFDLGDDDDDDYTPRQAKKEEPKQAAKADDNDLFKAASPDVKGIFSGFDNDDDDVAPEPVKDSGFDGDSLLSSSLDFGSFEEAEVKEMPSINDSDDSDDFMIERASSTAPAAEEIKESDKEDEPDLTDIPEDISVNENDADSLLPDFDFSDLEAPADDLMPSFDFESSDAPAGDMMSGFEELPVEKKEEERHDPTELPSLDLSELGINEIQEEIPAPKTKKRAKRESLIDSMPSSDDLFSAASSSISQEDLFGPADNDIFGSSSSSSDIFEEKTKKTEEKTKKTGLSAFSDDIFGSSDGDLFGDDADLFSSKPSKKKDSRDIFSSSSDFWGESESKAEETKKEKKAEEKPVKKAEKPAKKAEEKKEEPVGTDLSDLFGAGSGLDDLFDLSGLAPEIPETEDYEEEAVTAEEPAEEVHAKEEAEAEDSSDEIAQLEKILSANPSNNDTRKSLIETCMKLGEYDKAYQNTKELIAHASPDFENYAEIVRVFAKAGKEEELKDISEGYMSNAEIKTEFIPDICKALKKAGKIDLAIAECRKASKANPSNTDLSLILGKLYTEAGNYALATLQYQKAIRKAKDPSINILLAEAYQKMNNISGAAKTFKKYLSSVPSDKDIWVKYLIIAGREAADEDKDDFRKAISANPLTESEKEQLREALGSDYI